VSTWVFASFRATGKQTPGLLAHSTVLQLLENTDTAAQNKKKNNPENNNKKPICA